MQNAFRVALAGVPLLLSSCASMYFPPAPNAPLLTQKGEFSGGAHVNFQGNFTAQGAYAATNHLGIIGTASFLHTDKKKKALDHDFGEFGVGYFTRLKDKRVIEAYAGYGFGTSSRTERTREGEVTERRDARLEKYFVQVNYSSKDSKTVRLLQRDWPISYGTALRVSYMNMYDFQLNNQPGPSETNILLEPITWTRVGLFGPVQFQFISGSNFGLRHRKYMKAANSVFNFGLIFSVGGQEGRR
ncbi:hypothetical protein HER32_14540 [Hymenobacter sp. BT18]|uniref:hypothetical protein n=1 Tax=Hymenobacter sp. BT18 TaxID=2835648 RepID=UPI00143E464B|nr:hypothetical protein [Hymenobacter sp. BT18]QIX62330.1 hypothetical protein HER32_14540 [Hymenobacter sp. BT18]